MTTLKHPYSGSFYPHGKGGLARTRDFKLHVRTKKAAEEKPRSGARSSRKWEGLKQSFLKNQRVTPPTSRGRPSSFFAPAGGKAHFLSSLGLPTMHFFSFFLDRSAGQKKHIHIFAPKGSAFFFLKKGQTTALRCNARSFHMIYLVSPPFPPTPIINRSDSDSLTPRPQFPPPHPEKSNRTRQSISSHPQHRGIWGEVEKEIRTAGYLLGGGKGRGTARGHDLARHTGFECCTEGVGLKKHTPMDASSQYIYLLARKGGLKGNLCLGK